MNSATVIQILLIFPFVSGLLIILLEKTGVNAIKFNGKDRAEFIKAASLLLSAAEFILALVLFVSCDPDMISLSPISAYIPQICGFGISLTLDGFRLIFVLIASFMWMMTTFLSRQYFSGHENTERFYIFTFLTLGATIGVFLSADLFTTFIFFEIMSFTSYVWVAHEESESALSAADTYLAVAVIGGLVMLMGIFGLYHELGTLEISSLYKAACAYENKKNLYILGGCLLFGFGAKAGAFPLHIWLPKAHPVAPAPASALLSGILTKTGIFGVIAVTSEIFLYDSNWGMLILILGAFTMFAGALLAVFSVDIKRTLACSSVSQIGFILIGTGMQALLKEENSLAVHGTLLHMINHSLIKLVLFMSAGVIFMNAHALNLNKIRGFGKKKPLLAAVFLIGALAIGGIPLFGGYISKTLLHESIAEYGAGMFIKCIEYLFIFSGGLTLAYMAKLFVSVFIESNQERGLQKKYDSMKNYMDKESLFALSASAAVLLVWGLFPHMLMDKAALLGQGFMSLSEFGHEINYFSLENLSGALVSVAVAFFVYFIFIRKLLMKDNAYIDVWPNWLDIETLIYRPLLLVVLPTLCSLFSRVFDCMADMSVVILRKTVYKDSPVPHERTEGNWITDAAGSVMNFMQKIANLTWMKKRPIYVNHRHTLAMRYEKFRESNIIIGRSLSFGLMLVGIGMSLTLVYILLIIK